MSVGRLGAKLHRKRHFNSTYMCFLKDSLTVLRSFKSQKTTVWEATIVNADYSFLNVTVFSITINWIALKQQQCWTDEEFFTFREHPGARSGHSSNTGIYSSITWSLEQSGREASQGRYRRGGGDSFSDPCIFRSALNFTPEFLSVSSSRCRFRLFNTQLSSPLSALRFFYGFDALQETAAL